MNLLVTHQFNVLSGASRDHFSDLRLITECGSSVNIHKVVAAAVSSLLKKLIIGKQADELSIRNVKYHALESVVDFIYSGKITLSEGDDTQDFVAAYKILEINLGTKCNTVVQKLAMSYNSEVEDSSQEQNEYKCSTCNKVMERKQFLRHMREVHRKDKPKPKEKFPCENCDEVYTVA